ncbi:MAG: GntR family transcriptional regulator [Dongiaceae bacterium]
MANERLGYRPLPELMPVGDEQATTQAARAHAAIRRKIVTCELRPGSVVNERALMEALDFGRTPVREALLRLASERLVVFKANQSIQVAPVGFEEVRELYEVRLHAERMAWRLWLHERSDEDVERLAHCFDTAEALIAAERPSEVVNLDFDFHAFAWRNAGNRFLAQHLYNLGGLSYRLWHLTGDRSPPQMRDLVASHTPILDAFRAGDEAALDRALYNHINDAFEYVMERLKGHGLDRVRQIDIVEFGRKAAR